MLKRRRHVPVDASPEAEGVVTSQFLVVVDERYKIIYIYTDLLTCDTTTRVHSSFHLLSVNSA